jgi:hypothetical protein
MTSSDSRYGVSVRATIHARNTASAIDSPVFTSDSPMVLSTTSALAREIARERAAAKGSMSANADVDGGHGGFARP